MQNEKTVDLFDKIFKIIDDIKVSLKNIEDNTGRIIKENTCVEDCIYRSGRVCILDIGNHCTRRAEDFYEQKNLTKVEEKS